MMVRRCHQFDGLRCADAGRCGRCRVRWGDAMDTHILFRTDEILVTPTVVRFGPVSYQVATITSVAVHNRQRFNPFAVALVLAAFALAAFGFFGREQYPDYGMWAGIASPVALIAGIALQRFRPVQEYSLVAKTAGNETETITSYDRTQAFDLRDAIENAFLMQRMAVEQPGSVSTAPKSAADEELSDGLQISRDWQVVNLESATR